MVENSDNEKDYLRDGVLTGCKDGRYGIGKASVWFYLASGGSPLAVRYLVGRGSQMLIAVILHVAGRGG